MNSARRVRVCGRVQGVFFRQSTVDKARSLGVTGWVRNCPDGSVEAHVEGDEDALALMLEWLRHGPSVARVDGVDIQDSPPENAPDFEMRA